MAQVCVRSFQSSVIVEGRSDNNMLLRWSHTNVCSQRSVDVRRARALDTGAASAPYGAVYFKRLPP